MSSLTRRDLLLSGIALSATTLVGASVKRAQAMLPKYAGVPSAEASSAVAPRERLLFDFDWKFLQGNGADPLHDLGFGKGQGDFAKSGEFEFATVKFDDSKWHSLNLPHDWAVELPIIRDEEQQSHGYKPLGRRYPETSIGRYRRTFNVPKEAAVRRIVKGNSTAIALGTVVQNQGTNAESCRVRWQILDHSGKVVGTADSAAQSVSPDGSATFTATANLNNPALWSPESPNLYSALATVESAGKTRDA